jgi:hypothetical protein
MLYREETSPASEKELRNAEGPAARFQILSRTSEVLKTILVDAMDERADVPTGSLFLRNEDRVPSRKFVARQQALHFHQTPQDADLLKDCICDDPSQRSSSFGDLCQLIPVVRDRLYFMVLDTPQEVAMVKTGNPEFRFFSSTHHESYVSCCPPTVYPCLSLPCLGLGGLFCVCLCSIKILYVWCAACFVGAVVEDIKRE